MLTDTFGQALSPTFLGASLPSALLPRVARSCWLVPAATFNFMLAIGTCMSIIRLVCLFVLSLGALALTPDGFALVANLGLHVKRVGVLALLVVSTLRSRGDLPLRRSLSNLCHTGCTLGDPPKFFRLPKGPCASSCANKLEPFPALGVLLCAPRLVPVMGCGLDLSHFTSSCLAVQIEHDVQLHGVLKAVHIRPLLA